MFGRRALSQSPVLLANGESETLGIGIGGPHGGVHVALMGFCSGASGEIRGSLCPASGCHPHRRSKPRSCTAGTALPRNPPPTKSVHGHCGGGLAASPLLLMDTGDGAPRSSPHLPAGRGNGFRFLGLQCLPGPSIDPVAMNVRGGSPDGPRSGLWASGKTLRLHPSLIGVRSSVRNTSSQLWALRLRVFRGLGRGRT